jgi:hypothetical protein
MAGMEYANVERAAEGGSERVVAVGDRDRRTRFARRR